MTVRFLISFVCMHTLRVVLQFGHQRRENVILNKARRSEESLLCSRSREILRRVAPQNDKDCKVSFYSGKSN